MQWRTPGVCVCILVETERGYANRTVVGGGSRPCVAWWAGLAPGLMVVADHEGTRALTDPSELIAEWAPGA